MSHPVDRLARRYHDSARALEIQLADCVGELDTLAAARRLAGEEAWYTWAGGYVIEMMQDQRERAERDAADMVLEEQRALAAELERARAAAAQQVAYAAAARRYEEQLELRLLLEDDETYVRRVDAFRKASTPDRVHRMCGARD